MSFRESFRGPSAEGEKCARRRCGHSPMAHGLIGNGTCNGDGEPCRCTCYWFSGQPDPLSIPAPAE